MSTNVITHKQIDFKFAPVHIVGAWTFTQKVPTILIATYAPNSMVDLTLEFHRTRGCTHITTMVKHRKTHAVSINRQDKCMFIYNAMKNHDYTHDMSSAFIVGSRNKTGEYVITNRKADVVIKFKSKYSIHISAGLKCCIKDPAGEIIYEHSRDIEQIRIKQEEGHTRVVRTMMNNLDVFKTVVLT